MTRRLLLGAVALYLFSLPTFSAFTAKKYIDPAIARIDATGRYLHVRVHQVTVPKIKCRAPVDCSRLTIDVVASVPGTETMSRIGTPCEKRPVGSVCGPADITLDFDVSGRLKGVKKVKIGFAVNLPTGEFVQEVGWQGVDILVQQAFACRRIDKYSSEGGKIQQYFAVIRAKSE